MPIMDSKKGKIVKEYSIEELKKQAAEMRAWNLASLCAAGSGHSGGTLSIMDITAALYLKIINHDPKNPDWDERDRVIWSTGHKAPALYTGLAFSGYFGKKECLKLRKLWGSFEGHPNRLKLKGVEASSGSLGQGLSIAVGSAIRAKADKKNYRVFCIMGDGEQQEGQVWEAALEAAHFKLDNLIGIIDENQLQIDGFVKDIMNVFPLADKYRAFGWHVIETDGHDMAQIVDAFKKAFSLKEKPIMIIAKTVKGKGVSFMENIAGWHGKVPSIEETKKAFAELKVNLNLEELLDYAQDYQKEVEKKIEKSMPKFSKDYWWNKQANMKAKMEPTRMGFGNCLQKKGDDKRLFCLGADTASSIRISGFYEKNPERKERWCSMGISEQSGTCVAAGLAKEGKISVFGTYATFASGRALDQLRTTVCYNNYNVKIAGAHGGVSVGPDGATHQALEDFFQTCSLPNMKVIAPADSIETERLCNTCFFEIDGPVYARFAREATPIVTTPDTPLKFGTANIIRYKGEKENFADAFETTLATEYKSQGEDIAIVSNGPETAEAMRAAWILKEEFGIETRIINMHTMKPFDKETIIKAAKECGTILTAEEHQIGGIGNYVASAILLGNIGKPVAFDMIGVKDEFGLSGAPWELVKAFGLTAEHIAEKAKKMIKSAKI
ncbi:MAG: transketolase [Candidatus ainarchaeum sp.]|nr:transketolase [Candidatus ainarchaeum sp.]